MKSVNEKISLFFILFIIIIFSIIWPFILPLSNWPTDYGHHFYISMTNTDKGLYKDFFTHKGPVLVFFIDVFQNILGTTWKSSITVLSCLTLFFLTIASYTSYKYTRNYLTTLIIILYIIFFFRYQTSDIFVDLINVPLILLANLFFLKAITDNKKEYIFLYSFFISLSFLSRVDTLIYIFVSLVFLLFFAIKEKKFNYIKIIFVLKNISIFILIFILLSFIYKFNFIEFMNQNIFFNMMYSSDDYKKFTNLGSLFALIPYKHYSFILIIKLIYFIKSKEQIGRNNSIIFSLFSLIQLLIFFQKFGNLYLFLSIFIFEILFMTYLIAINKSKNYELLFILLINFSSFFIYLYSGSYKLNHSFILIPGTVIFTLYFLKHIFKKQINYKNLSCLFLVFLFFYQSEKIYRSINQSFKQANVISIHNKFSNLFYNKNLIEKNNLIKILKKDNPPIICGRGWLHIFSNTESRGLMFDWWMYDERKKIKFDKHYEYMRNIKDKKFGNFFLINTECVNSEIFSKNEHINHLLKNSDKIEEFTILKNVSYHYRKLK